VDISEVTQIYEVAFCYWLWGLQFARGQVLCTG